MSADTDADRGWLHQLGRAEGIESLVDDELLEKERERVRTRKRMRGRERTRQKRADNDCCVLCGDDAESLQRVPDGDVCPDCFDEVNEAMADTCSTFGCNAPPLRDDGECKRCDQSDPRAYRP